MSQPKESENIDGQKQIETQTGLTASETNKKKGKEAQTQEKSKTTTKQTKRGKNKSKGAFYCLD